MQNKWATVNLNTRTLYKSDQIIIVNHCKIVRIVQTLSGAGSLTTLYTKKARDVDQKIIGTPAGTRGSVETELSSMERSWVSASEHGEREAEMFMIWLMSLPSQD